MWPASRANCPFRAKEVALTHGPAERNATNNYIILFNNHTNLAVENEEYGQRRMKRKRLHIFYAYARTEAKVTNGQNSFHIICPVAYRNGECEVDADTKWAVTRNRKNKTLCSV